MPMPQGPAFRRSLCTYSTLVVTATTWIDTASALRDIATVVAIAAGGAFAYIKFVRSRVLHTRMDVDLQLKEVVIADAYALLITALVTNSGTLRLIFPSTAGQVLVITLADGILWDDTRNAVHREVLWSEGITCYEQDILVVEGRRETNPDQRDPDPYLEPGERLSRMLLVPLPPGEWVAYRAHLSVKACSRTSFRKGRVDVWKKELIRAKGQADG